MNLRLRATIFLVPALVATASCARQRDAWNEDLGVPPFAGSASALETWWPVVADRIPQASAQLESTRFVEIDAQQAEVLTGVHQTISAPRFFLVRGLRLSSESDGALEVRWDDREHRDALSVLFTTNSCFFSQPLRRAPIVVELPRVPRSVALAELPDCP